jgi:tartrate/fumarate subfamily iron-sulfur-dependent hydro-lyase beta chain
MTEARAVTLPLSRDEAKTLRVGELVEMTGSVYTMRDATHAKVAEALSAEGVLPYGLDGQTVFYAGPTPARADRPVGSVGPTTAKRMDAWTPELLDAGIVATIGKGPRSAEVRDACVRNGAVYLAAVGGSAALLARHVAGIETIAWPELGTEALMRMELAGFPAYVGIDTLGADVYEDAVREWARDDGGQA